jgi:maleate isomerase
VPAQEIVAELLAKTGATRTTLRVDAPPDVFPVAAEALAPGARSIAGETRIDLRAAPTFVFLDRERRPLVQDDLATAADAPPPELIELYGVRAQMLAPIVRDGRLYAMVSVHYAPGPRRWTEEDVEALRDATRRLAAELGAEAPGSA